MCACVRACVWVRTCVHVRGGGGQGCIRREGTSEAEEVAKAVGAGYYCRLQMPLTHLPSGGQWLGMGWAPCRAGGTSSGQQGQVWGTGAPHVAWLVGLGPQQIRVPRPSPRLRESLLGEWGGWADPARHFLALSSRARSPAALGWAPAPLVCRAAAVWLLGEKKMALRGVGGTEAHFPNPPPPPPPWPPCREGGFGAGGAQPAVPGGGGPNICGSN